MEQHGVWMSLEHRQFECMACSYKETLNSLCRNAEVFSKRFLIEGEKKEDFGWTLLILNINSYYN